MGNTKMVSVSMGILIRIIQTMVAVAQLLGNKYFADAIDGLMYKLDGNREQLLLGSSVVVYKENWSTEIKFGCRNWPWFLHITHQSKGSLVYTNLRYYILTIN